MQEKIFPCPCGGADYATCCGRLHKGIPAPDAESLMRSRYSAYALELEPYLLATWHYSTRPAKLDLATGTTKWIALEIKEYLPESAARATVEFVACYKSNGRARRMHEVSRFVYEEGWWFYVDGKIINSAQ